MKIEMMVSSNEILLQQRLKQRQIYLIDNRHYRSNEILLQQRLKQSIINEHIPHNKFK